jgi:hypothetical protein
VISLAVASFIGAIRSSSDRSLSILREARDSGRVMDEHEEVEIAAAVRERRFVLLADLCNERHRAMVLS